HAASLMWSSDCGCIPVVSASDGRQIVGIITDRDVCVAALFKSKMLRDICVEDAMAKKVLVCRASDKIEDAQRQMEEEQIRRLPVVDNNGKLMGIVSMADIVCEPVRSECKQHPDISASDVTA